MSKLIPLDEAANILGMTVEQITELRSNHEIFGYRDGQNWKFKMTELERVAGELDIKLNVSGAAKVADDLSENFGFNLEDSSDDLILDDDSSSGSGPDVETLDSAEFAEESSVELFQNPIKEELQIAADSEAIDLDDDGDGIELHDSGLLKMDSAKGLADSGLLKLDDSGELNLEDSGLLKLEDSGVLNLEDSGVLASKSDVMADDGELSFGSSSLSLASESSKLLGGDPAGTGSDLLDEEIKKTPSGSDTGKMLAGGDDDDLILAGDDDLFSEELSLADSGSFEESAELSSDFEDSGDLVLDDSDSNSEIMLEDSGIDLSANESGIAIGDEPLELGGSDIDALELPEDDDDMIVLEDAADPESATMMQEDDFNLTPLEASMEEDDSSGSQVIALEDSEIYADDTSATILGEADAFPAEPAMLDDGGIYDDTMAGGAMIAGGAMMAGGAMAAPAGMHTGPAAPVEAPYSIWQVISLGLVTALLMTGGMVAYNLAQNMWMPADQVIGNSVLNFFLKLTGMN